MPKDRGALTALRAEGYSDECAHIELRVACLEATVGGVVESSFVVTPSDTGFWTAELP